MSSSSASRRCRLEAPKVLVERVDEHPDTADPARAPKRTPRAREPSRVGARSELGEQPRLADPRLAHQLAVPPNGPVPSSERTRSSAPSSSARPTRCSASKTTLLRGEHRSEAPDQEIRVFPRCRRGRVASGSMHVPLRAPPPPRAARVRGRVRLVQGPREPASPPGDARLMPLRRSRDLVDSGRRVRSGRARRYCRSTSPSARPQQASARSRSHDRAVASPTGGTRWSRPHSPPSGPTPQPTAIG